MDNYSSSRLSLWSSPFLSLQSSAQNHQSPFSVYLSRPYSPVYPEPEFTFFHSSNGEMIQRGPFSGRTVSLTSFASTKSTWKRTILTPRCLLSDQKRDISAISSDKSESLLFQLGPLCRVYREIHDLCSFLDLLWALSFWTVYYPLSWKGTLLPNGAQIPLLSFSNDLRPLSPCDLPSATHQTRTHHRKQLRYLYRFEPEAIFCFG